MVNHPRNVWYQKKTIPEWWNEGSLPLQIDEKPNPHSTIGFSVDPAPNGRTLHNCIITPTDMEVGTKGQFHFPPCCFYLEAPQTCKSDTSQRRNTTWKEVWAQQGLIFMGMDLISIIKMNSPYRQKQMHTSAYWCCLLKWDTHGGILLSSSRNSILGAWNGPVWEAYVACH